MKLLQLQVAEVCATCANFWPQMTTKDMMNDFEKIRHAASRRWTGSPQPKSSRATASPRGSMRSTAHYCTG